MTYYLYHIPGKKIGITKDLKKRVEEQQGYHEGEYDVILQTEDLKFNNTNMNINITEATTTFPCPMNKLKGQLMDNIGMSWETDHGSCVITKESIRWIIENIQISRYNNQRCYVYNKAMARWFDNNDAYDQYDGKTKSGGLQNDQQYECCDENNPCNCVSQFDLIREWADERGLYENGDTKTQALKLVEEVGETCRAILKEDYEEVTDGIGDCVVVLTNLAELHGVSIEECIEKAYNEIKNRKGMMANGTYVKQ